jgi:hypothetical protein
VIAHFDDAKFLMNGPPARLGLGPPDKKSGLPANKKQALEHIFSYLRVRNAAAFVFYDPSFQFSATIVNAFISC